MSDVLTPRFRIDYGFSVHFTRDAFAADNDVLAGVLANPGGRPPARCLVAIDAAVLRARPELPRAIHAWFHQREERGLRLAADPLAIDGGEAAKASLAVVERIGGRCAELGLCRHSYVVMIGGGAVLDAVGLAAQIQTELIHVPPLSTARFSPSTGQKTYFIRSRALPRNSSTPL